MAKLENKKNKQFFIEFFNHAKANLNDYNRDQITHRNIINFVFIKMRSKHLF